ncbi:MAG TPA: ethanolamine ammonia-lyase subunit EutC [Gemmataceae bacterium]|jgi:ethanolamine ammonia-lyase small subunit|nr:ethanolamine ammonia-lyase subunit EutC [Gemmataceae bacterium]
MNEELARVSPSELLAAIRARTPARLLVGRTGTAYVTATQMELRQAHAAARDAVNADLDLCRDLGEDFVARHQLFDVQTRARSKAEFLLRPDLGRRLSEQSMELIRRTCPARCDWQIVIGDGLSATAVAAQVPGLLPRLFEEGDRRSWIAGRPFVVRYCRVGILNEIGDLLDPAVVVLLIGERPGLATAESLSAYMAYRPKAGHTDAQRNLISNIHSRGVNHVDAARRIAALAERMMCEQHSGVTVKEVGT